MIEHANIFYISNFNVIGGTEQFIYEVAKKYYKYDIGVIYKTGHENQVKRLKKYVPVYQYKGEKIKCKKFFCNYEVDLLDEAEFIEDTEKIDYCQVEHAMFKTQGIKPHIHEKLTNIMAVSNIVSKEFEELTGIKSYVVRNPLTITPEEDEDVLMLVAATRLTQEKGKERIEELIHLLDLIGKKFFFIIFTNDTNIIRHPNVCYMSPRLDVRPYIKMIKGKGYGVQVSSAEGDCYFTRECEAFGVPLLCTPLPSFKEQGLIDGVNCYYLPFDMKITNDRLDEIINNIPKYEGYIRPDYWDRILNKTKSNYKEEHEMTFIVEALDTYERLNISDGETGTIIKEGTRFTVSKERLEVLLGNNSYKVPFVKVVEEKAVLPKNKEEKAILPKVNKKSKKK